MYKLQFYFSWFIFRIKQKMFRGDDGIINYFIIIIIIHK